MSEIFDLKALVSADVSPFNKAMDASADSVNASLSAINAAANAFIGSGFIRTFVKATDKAYEFGQVMADVSSISDVNIKKLSNSIARMENVYGKMSTVGNTIYETISSGIRGSEKDYIHFTEVVGQTSKSIRADLEDTANIITTLTNAYGLGIGDVQKLSDMLFVTVREGKAHGNELARTLGLVTNTAAEAGVTLSELTAAISILSRTQSASQSMIALNQMLNAIIKPTQEAQREANRWGIEIGANALKTKGFTAILTEMHEKVGGNVNAINAMLGNIRAMRAGTALTGRQFNNFIDVLRTAEAEIGSGVAFKAFEKQTVTAEQALKNLQTQIDKTFIKVGQDIEPITKPLIEIAEGVLKNFNDSSPIARWVTYATALHVAFKAVHSTVLEIRKTMSALTGGGSSAKAILGAATASASEKMSIYRHQLSYFDKNATVYNERLHSLVREGHFKTPITQLQAEGYFSERDIKDFYSRTLSSMSDTFIQDQTVLAQHGRYLRDRINAEREFGEAIKSKYDAEIEVQTQYVNNLKASHAKTLATLQANEAKLANLNIWDFAGSSAILSKHQDTHFAKSGGRTLYNTRMARERSDATMQYLNMLTEADIDAVLSKTLNPLRGEMEGIAKRNIAQMYHLEKDEEGVITGAIAPSGAKVDYNTILRAERNRVEKGFAAARGAYRTFVQDQQAGIADFASQKINLTSTIEKQKIELEALKSDLEVGNEELARSKDAASKAVKAHRSRLKQLNAEMRVLGEDQAARREQYRIEIAEVKQRLRSDLDNYRTQRDSNAQRLELQRKIAQKEQELLSIEQQRLALLGSKEYKRQDPTHRRLATERYNRRYGTQLTGDAVFGDSRLNRQLRVAGQRFSKQLAKLDFLGIGNSAKALGKGFSAVAKVVGSTFLPAVSAAVIGWDIGKAIGQHFKLADSELVKWIAKLKIWNTIDIFGYLGHLGGTKSDTELKEVESRQMEALRKVAVNRIDEATMSGKLTESASMLLTRQVLLAKSYEDLQKLIAKIIKGHPKNKVESVADIDAQTAKDIENIAKSPVTTRKDIKRRIESRDRLSNMLNKLNLGDVGKHAGTKLTAEDLASLYSIDDTEARKKKAVELRNKLKKSETRMERWTSVSTPYGTQLVRTDKKVATTDTQQLMYNQVANDIITAVIASMSREGRGSEADKVRTQLIRDRLVQGEQDAANALIKAYREDPSSLPFDVETTEAYKARRTRIQGDALGGRLAGETATDFKAAEKALKEREQKYTTLSGDINKRHRALLDNPDLRKRLTKAEAAKALEPAYRDLDLERKKIEEARKVVLDYGKEAIDASSTYLENVSNKLQFEGKDAESYVYKSAMTEAITSEIARLKDVLSQTTTDAVKNQLRAQIVALQKKRGDLTKVDSKALSGFMSTFVDGLSSASKRREDALSNGVKYRGLNSQEMWHSVNMLSRVAGNGIARRAFVPAYQVRDGIRARDLQAKARAEQQVYAAADSFIMSKKYEEANLGKTVVNIYDFMRNNNTIMVNK